MYNVSQTDKMRILLRGEQYIKRYKNTVKSYPIHSHVGLSFNIEVREKFIAAFGDKDLFLFNEQR